MEFSSCMVLVTLLKRSGFSRGICTHADST